MHYRFDVPATPVWARLLGAWRGWRRARQARRDNERAKAKYHLIVSVPAETQWTDVGTTSVSYYVLFEDGHGNRKHEYRPGSYLLNDKRGELSHPTYIRFIEPWLHGKYTNQWIIDLVKRHYTKNKG